MLYFLKVESPENKHIFWKQGIQKWLWAKVKVSSDQTASDTATLSVDEKKREKGDMKRKEIESVHSI